MNPRYFETDRLREKGVHRARVTLEQEGFTEEFQKRVQRAAEISSDKVLAAYRLRVEGVAADDAVLGQLGFLEGMVIDHDDFDDVALVYFLYTEASYVNCGIGTWLLDAVPEFLSEELRFRVRAVLAIPVSQEKTEEGGLRKKQDILALLEIPMLYAFYTKRGFLMGDPMQVIKFVKTGANDKWTLMLEALEQNNLLTYEMVLDSKRSMDMVSIPIGKCLVPKEYKEVYTMESLGSVKQLVPISEYLLVTRLHGVLSYAQLSEALAEYGLSIEYVLHDPERLFLHTYYADYVRGIYGTLMIQRDFAAANADALGEMSAMMEGGNRAFNRGDWARFYGRHVPMPLLIYDFSRRVRSLPVDQVFDIWYQVYKNSTYSNGTWSWEVLDYVFSHAPQPRLPDRNTDGAITVYRGAGALSQAPEAALSWSTSPAHALWFANHSGNGLQWPRRWTRRM